MLYGPPPTRARGGGGGGPGASPWATRHSRSLRLSCGLYFASQITCSHAARAVSAARLVSLVWHGPLSRARNISLPVAVWRGGRPGRGPPQTPGTLAAPPPPPRPPPAHSPRPQN